MSNTMKTVLLVGGTALATGVVLDIMTEGAVRAAVCDKVNGIMHSGSEAVADAAQGVADATAPQG